MGWDRMVCLCLDMERRIQRDGVGGRKMRFEKVVMVFLSADDDAPAVCSSEENTELLG